MTGVNKSFVPCLQDWNSAQWKPLEGEACVPLSFATPPRLLYLPTSRPSRRHPYWPPTPHVSPPSRGQNRTWCDPRRWRWAAWEWTQWASPDSVGGSGPSGSACAPRCLHGASLAATTQEHRTVQLWVHINNPSNQHLILLQCYKITF